MNNFFVHKIGVRRWCYTPFLLEKFYKNFKKGLTKYNTCIVLKIARGSYSLTNIRASSKKGEKMEGMTNEQFNIVIKMVVQIVKDSESKEEAIKKIEALLEK